MHFANSLQLPMPRLKLLETLKLNKGKHIKEFDLAVIGFHQLCEKELASRLAEVKAHLFKDHDLHKVLSFNHQAPVSMEKAYTEVIEMLEFSEEEVITITGDQYRAWVKDEWDWSHSVFSNSVYASTVSGCRS